MSYSVAMLSVHTSPLDLPGRTKDAGGMNVYMRELAKALADRTITVDIFTRWTDPSLPQIVYLAPHVRVIHLQAGPIAPVHKHDLYQYIHAFVHAAESFRATEETRYDIVHSHYWLSGVAGFLLARNWDVPHVTMFHTLARLKQLANPAEVEPQQRLEMEQCLVQHADRIIAATNDERMQMIRSCGATAGQIDVIPCGVDQNLFVPHDQQEARLRYGLDPSRPVLLFAGRLDPFKGPDLFLRAAALMQEDAQVVLVGGALVGGDKELQQLETLASELEIRERVHFLGARPQEELPVLFSAATVTVVPSYHESFGLVAVESLACGTPVVATRAGGLTTVIRHGETGFLVPRCAGFFAERLDALLRDSELYQTIAVATRPSVLRFSWSSIARQMHTIYDELVQERRYLAVQ